VRHYKTYNNIIVTSYHYLYLPIVGTYNTTTNNIRNKTFYHIIINGIHNIYYYYYCILGTRENINY
jgi:hypothetical protein